MKCENDPFGLRIVQGRIQARVPGFLLQQRLSTTGNIVLAIPCLSMGPSEGFCPGLRRNDSPVLRGLPGPARASRCPVARGATRMCGPPRLLSRRGGWHGDRRHSPGNSYIRLCLFNSSIENLRHLHRSQTGQGAWTGKTHRRRGQSRRARVGRR